MKRKSDGGNKPAFVKRKTEVVFDANKRKEFLTGFHKRKLHRKKVAQSVIERKLKEETRRIRAEAKDNVKKLYHSYKPIPELEHDLDDEQEYDTENVTVKVVELSTVDLAKQNNWIGENRAVIRGDEDVESNEESTSDDEEADVATIAGMELDGEKPSKNKKTKEKQEASTGELEPEQHEEKTQKPRSRVLNLDGIRSKKELNHKLKRHAQKSMKKCKAFQQTVRAQQQKQLKKSRRVRHFKEKHLKRKGNVNTGKKGQRNGRGGKAG